MLINIILLHFFRNFVPNFNFRIEKMDQNLLEAVKLMIVGMTTVFVILLIVINLSKLLINLINRYAPEEVAVAKKSAAPSASKVDASVMGVLEAAVSQITGGKGKISKVTKI